MVCNISRKTEVKIIATAFILISISWAILCILLLYKNHHEEWDFLEELIDWTVKYRNQETFNLKIGLSLLMVAANFIVSSVLLRGIQKGQKSQLVPWLVCIPIGIGIDLLLVIYEAYNIFTANPDQINLSFVIISLCFWTITIFLQSYFWIVVLMEYQALKKYGKEHQLGDMIRQVISEESMGMRRHHHQSRTNISVAHSVHGRSIYQSTLSLNQLP